MSTLDVIVFLIGLLVGYLLAFNPFAALVVILILVLILLVARGERRVP